MEGLAGDKRDLKNCLSYIGVTVTEGIEILERRCNEIEDLVKQLERKNHNVSTLHRQGISTTFRILFSKEYEGKRRIEDIENRLDNEYFNADNITSILDEYETKNDARYEYETTQIEIQRLNEKIKNLDETFKKMADSIEEMNKVTQSMITIIMHTMNPVK